MKITLVLLLTGLGVFGIWKFVLGRKPVVKINQPVSVATSELLDQCIQKLNSKEKLCLKDFKGKKILLVNVASECGFTKQYKDLEQLYQTHKDKLVIIGFPCNQFAGQESGTEEEIEKFCSSKFNVTFPLTTKISVKGDNQHPIYAWLTQKSKNKVSDYSVTWNFNKFLVDENGQLIGYFSSKVNPMDASITDLLK